MLITKFRFWKNLLFLPNASFHGGERSKNKEIFQSPVKHVKIQILEEHLKHSLCDESQSLESCSLWLLYMHILSGSTSFVRQK